MTGKPEVSPSQTEMIGALGGVSHPTQALVGEHGREASVTRNLKAYEKSLVISTEAKWRDLLFTLPLAQPIRMPHPEP
jgi:hypothetical protein